MKSVAPHCIEHSLVSHHLAIVRDQQSSSAEFRHALSQLTTVVTVEACRKLALAEVTVATPISEVRAQKLAERVGLVPILRAGIGMVQPVLALIPDAEVWHLGLYRDESTAEPVHYYSKLPAQNPVDQAFVLDPMLATGGSACLACQRLSHWGVTRITMLSIIAAPEGIDRLQSEFPQVQIYTCAVDECLNEQKFIVPGLGDAGDRLFNTIP